MNKMKLAMNLVINRRLKMCSEHKLKNEEKSYFKYSFEVSPVERGLYIYLFIQGSASFIRRQRNIFPNYFFRRSK